MLPASHVMVKEKKHGPFQKPEILGCIPSILVLVTKKGTCDREKEREREIDRQTDRQKDRDR